MATPLHRARKKKAASAYEVAEAVGVHQSQYSRVEKGSRRPGPDLAIRLAEYFHGELTRDQIMFPEFYPELTAEAS